MYILTPADVSSDGGAMRKLLECNEAITTIDAILMHDDDDTPKKK